MNLGALQKKLIASARLSQPDERVPYAFEKRIMAHLADRAVTTRRNLWVRGLWRAAVSCVAIALVCGSISLFMPSTGDAGNDLSQDFENTLLASVDQSDLTP